MRRVHLLEIEGQPWCPGPVWDGGTDWLHLMASTHQAFDAIAPKLRGAMRRSGSDRIVDLCSGGGGPWLSLAPLLARSGRAEVTLTDLYPNRNASRRIRADSAGSVEYCAEPVDATDVPAGLAGTRTLVRAFHHFRPREARADAVAKRRPIVVVEGSDSRLLGIALILLMPLAMLALTCAFDRSAGRG